MITRVTEPGLNRGRVLCHWDIPGACAGPGSHRGREGRSTVVVGANGSGESALGLWMEQHNGGFSRTRRLIAHRKL